MKLWYDLHIHSCLSPCGDNDMTPNNIVNMALLKGLDVIAVADHNSCGNVRSVMKVADGNILVVPAMEIETAEEVHILSLFPSIEAAEEMEEIIKNHSSGIVNNSEIFGNQLYMDENDNVTGEEERLLVSATTLDIYETAGFVNNLGGIAVPAHIDRTSYSVISNLGFIPPDINFPCVEITEKNRDIFSKDYKSYNIITDSDAHYLWDISEKARCLEVSNKKIENILQSLCKLP